MDVMYIVSEIIYKILHYSNVIFYRLFQKSCTSLNASIIYNLMFI